MNQAPVVCIIPARYSSFRLPGKPLVKIGKWLMIEWVYQRARQAKHIDEVWVATDDERVYSAVESFGGRAVMTSSKCRSGSERVAEALGDQAFSLVVNLQGDEPLMEPAAIDQLVEVFSQETEVQMATLMYRMSREEKIGDPNIVKVVVNHGGYALYFSRHAIPFHRDLSDPKPVYYHHYGLYAYRPATLKRFIELPVSPLEEAEKLEQLRALAGGIPIRVLETRHTTMGVDTPEDLEKVRRKVKTLGLTP